MQEAHDSDDGLVIEMIQQAVFAGGYWSLSREFPGHESGFFKLAARCSERVEALADEMLAGLVWRPVRPHL